MSKELFPKEQGMEGMFSQYYIQNDIWNRFKFSVAEYIEPLIDKGLNYRTK